MEYYSLNQYLKDTFGEKVYKIALDAGFTCPNRDGTLGTKGCIFCSGNGSGEFAERLAYANCASINQDNLVNDIKEQINSGKKRLEKKIKNGKYIAYFQAFTNTYAPVETLRRIFMAAIELPEIVAISIGTRPDCLGEEVLSLLDELNQIKPVWIELGLQTIHEKTANYIRRGYKLTVFDKAVHDLKQIRINTIVHVILGLPGESKEEMIDTVRYVGKSGVNGIKLQLLHVIKGTDLAIEYEEGKFKTLELSEYCELIKNCLEVLPKDIVIHRLTGDGDKKTLIAPLWSADKKRVLNTLNKTLSN